MDYLRRWRQRFEDQINLINVKYIFSIFLLVLGKVTVGQTNVQKIDSLLTSFYNSGSFHGNVLVADKGQIIYKNSFGYANETKKEKLNENSIFELASVSKQFTAMAIVILEEDGSLNLDDKISSYIPEFKSYDNISIRHLLNHTGGLPDYMEILDTVFDKSKIATNKDIVSVFARLKPAVLFEPNTRWEYSNTGYALLAVIIEKASGMAYEDFLRKAIFDPLKMENTFVYRRRYAPKMVENYAFGYEYSDSLKNYELPDNLQDRKHVIWLDGIVGDGTVNSTIMDLLKWDRALFTSKLVSKERSDQIFSASILADSSVTQYGFGWFVEDNGLFGKLAFHTGGWPGYRTLIERYIQNDKTLIVLLNHINEDTYIPQSDLRKLIFGFDLIHYIDLSGEEKKKYAGSYRNQEGKKVILELENDTLFRKYDSGEKMELRPLSGTKFQMIGFSPEVYYDFIVKDNEVEKYIMTQPEHKVERVLMRIR